MDMRVIEIAAPGGPEQLRLAHRAVPQPGPGEVLIRVAAAGSYGGLGVSWAVLSRWPLSGTRKGLCRVNARAILGRGRRAPPGLLSLA